MNNRMKWPAAVIAVALTFTAQADTIYVDADNCPGPGSGFPWDPYCSIQWAIDNAVDTDEIVVAKGTYFETINFEGKAVTLRSSAGPEVTIIDAQQAGTVVTCESSEGPGAVLDGFTITSGSAIIGGGMYNEDSNPTVTNCTFSGNSGGGMANNGSNPTVTNCTFSGNIADSGGGMVNSGSSPTVTNCTFSGNTTNVGRGGGMFNLLSTSNPTVTKCTFTGNTADTSGGGMANLQSSTTVTDCTFSGNTAVTGGGMFNQSASPTVTNCTFSGNTANVSGGMFNSATSNPTVTNCILWGDSPDEFTGGTPTVAYSNVQAGFPGTGNIDADPLFVDPDNGDFRLSAGSPCIDAGDNTAVPAGIDTDLDGNPRFHDDPGMPDTGNGDPPVVDMGAYEFQGSSSCPCDCEDPPDGTVDVGDFLALLAQWGSPGTCDCETPPDGIVDFADFLATLAAWGPCP